MFNGLKAALCPKLLPPGFISSMQILDSLWALTFLLGDCYWALTFLLLRDRLLPTCGCQKRDKCGKEPGFGEGQLFIQTCSTVASPVTLGYT